MPCCSSAAASASGGWRWILIPPTASRTRLWRRLNGASRYVVMTHRPPSASMPARRAVLSPRGKKSQLLTLSARSYRPPISQKSRFEKRRFRCFQWRAAKRIISEERSIASHRARGYLRARAAASRPVPHPISTQLALSREVESSTLWTAPCVLFLQNASGDIENASS
jgi:hypothetical protein